MELQVCQQILLMEIKLTQSTFLNNSIYLKNIFTQSQQFHRNDQIMIEQPLNESNIINESLIIKSISSEQNMPSQKQYYHYTAHHPISIEDAIPEDQMMKKPRSFIPRLCKMKFPKTIEEYTTHDTILDESRRRKRDSLAAKAKSRKQTAFQTLRQKVHEILVFQLTQQTESQIQKQNHQLDQQIRQQKVQNFIKRQQFARKEQQVLKQMRQFCLYGTIREQ